MTRWRTRVWAVGLCAALLAVCSDDPATPAPPPPAGHTDSADRAALIALYNATNGPAWGENTNWNTPASIRDWHGVATNSSGFVTELTLSSNNLSGTLPPALGDLSRLRRLVLHNNRLSGPIPAELGNLAQLTMLNLRSNSLSGTIPAALGALPRLDSLLLASNDLSGPIPVELGNLGSLRRLLLAWNRLSGPVPPELGNLASLTYMSLSRNELTGTIPPELANLSSIQVLSVSRNNLTGTIPPELGSLATLEGLYLYDNPLAGEIPLSLASLPVLETLWIHENGLSGPLPGEFGNLAELRDLRASNNQLSGELPRSLGKLQALTRLELDGNGFSGRLPSALGEARSLNRLWLDGNHGLTGLLPRSLLDLKYMQGLSYGETGLCAQIDDEFQEWLGAIGDGARTDCEVERVERLALARLHEVTGGPSWANRRAWDTEAPLGDWHGVATESGRVVEVSLPANGLSGTLPGEIANLTELAVVDLTGNGLSGALPGSVAGLRELAELRVGRNADLEGALPFALRRLKRVRALFHDDTGLCASPAPDFQAWYNAVAETAGAVCDNPDEVVVSLPMVYLTQSVQTPSRDVRLVANREALLRAFVTAEEPRGFFEPEVVAVLAGPDGGELHRAVMRRDANQVPAESDEGDLELSYNAVIPAAAVVPGARMVVEVDPGGTLPLAAGSQTRFPDEGAHALNVVEVPPMLLTLVPVMDAEEPDSSVVEWVGGISAESTEVGLLRHAFPFAEFDVRRLGALYTSLDLTTTAGQVALFGELEVLRASESGTGYYYGVVASMGSSAGRGQLPGWVSIGITRPTTLAHEVGHNLSLRHAPCGGPSGIDPAFPYPDGSIGVWGYDFRNGSLVPPGGGTDIMTYCRSLPWISDFHFEKVIDHRARLAAEVASARLAASDPPSDMLVLWGGAVDGELWIEPAFTMRAAARLPGAPGPYRVQGTGSGGESLFALDFAPGEDVYGGRHFFFTVPVEAGWEGALERITLTGPEGQAHLDPADERRITVVTEPGTGRVRAILRDWDGPLPEALRGDPDLRVSVTRGVREAVRVRR